MPDLDDSDRRSHNAPINVWIKGTDVLLGGGGGDGDLPIGLATEAKQDDQITILAGLATETKLNEVITTITSIDFASKAKQDTIIAAFTPLATSAKQDTIIAGLTTLETGKATAARQDTGNVSLAAIVAKFVPGGVTDRSGTITTGNTAQTLAAANSSRRWFFIQNNSVSDLWFNFGVTAVKSQPSIKLEQGAVYEMQMPTSSDSISVIGATTGQAFTAKEM